MPDSAQNKEMVKVLSSGQYWLVSGVSSSLINGNVQEHSLPFPHRLPPGGPMIRPQTAVRARAITSFARI